MFADTERIHRVNADVKFGGDVIGTAEVPAPMAEALMNDLPQVELATRFRNIGGVLIKKSNDSDNIKEPGATYAETSMFPMLGIELLYGDVKTVLDEPYTMVISRTMAEKFFPADQAVQRFAKKLISARQESIIGHAGLCRCPRRRMGKP